LKNKKPRENTTKLPTKKKIYITQNSYRRHPTAKRTDSKLQKENKKQTTPHHQFNRTVPATAGPKRKKKPYSPAVHTTRVPK
jgi:hypothetical protein